MGASKGRLVAMLKGIGRMRSDALIKPAAVGCLFATLFVSISNIPAAFRLCGGRRSWLKLRACPLGVRSAAVLSGPHLARRVTTHRLTLRGLHPGRYTLTVQEVTFPHAVGTVKPGARAVPAKKRVTIRVKAGASDSSARRLQRGGQPRREEFACEGARGCREHRRSKLDQCLG